MLLTTTAALGLSLGAAHAADIFVEEAPPPMVELPPAAYNWNGFYVGLHGGYGWADASSRYFEDWANVTCGFDSWCGSAVDVDPKGAFVGAQIGYNYVFGNGLLLGIEGDYSVSSLHDSDVGIFAGGSMATEVNANVDQLATIQARIGWAVDRWLPFVTVGWGWAHVERTAFNPETLGVTPVKDTNWHDGFTVGAGLEYGINDHWSVKGEYRYFNGGKERYNLSFAGGTEIDLNIHTVRFGVNYRF